MIVAEITFSQVAGASVLTLFASVTFFVLVGMILWPRIANNKLRELIPDDAETLIDGVSERVRDGVNRVTLPEDPELRFYWHLQKARELASGQDNVLEGLETARTEYESPKT